MIAVINANTLAVTEYDITTVGIMEHGGNLYFVESDALTKLGATGSDTDSTAIVETGMLNLGADEKKYIPEFKATLSGDSTTNAYMTLELDGDSIDMGPYELVGRSGAASFVRKWRPGGGVNADSISLKFQAQGGTAWKLQGLSISAELV